VVTALQNRKVYHSSSRKIWIFGIIVAFAGLAVLWIIWLNGTGICCPWVPLQPRPIPEVPDQTLNEHNPGFQVEPERSEEDPEVIPKEVPMIQSQPTVFVRHGRMVVDHP
jgi:hypothetical protein